MASTEQPNDLPVPETLEYDPAFELGEDATVEDEEADVVDADGNVVIPTPPALPDEERPVPLDDEFRGVE